MNEPQAARVTAFWFSAKYGLPCDLESLFALGQVAQRIARWEGLEECKVTEGPFQVHTWPEWVWAQAAELRAREQQRGV